MAEGCPLTCVDMVSIKAAQVGESLNNLGKGHEAMKLTYVTAMTALAVGTTACNPTTTTAANANATSTEHVAQTQKLPVPSFTTVVASSSTNHAPAKTSSPRLGPEYKKIDTFVEFRKKLLADGWKPVINPKCHEAVLGPFYERVCNAEAKSAACGVCERVPEIVSDVGGVGAVDGYNVMHYTKDGAPLSVTTYGDFDGLDESKKDDLMVVGWEYSASADAIPLDAVLPKRFSPSATVVIGSDMRCVAGAITDEDGMNQRPYVYVSDASGKRMHWVKALNVPKDFYESRVTHCLRKGDSIYVLQLSNTLPQLSLSQTFLRLVRLSVLDGHVLAGAEIYVPDVDDVYSEWADEGSKGLSSSESGLVISGQYRLQSNKERRMPFHVELPEDLNR